MDIKQQKIIVKNLQIAYTNATEALANGSLGKIKRYKIGDREMEYVDFYKYYQKLEEAYRKETKILQDMQSNNVSGIIFTSVEQDT